MKKIVVANWKMNPASSQEAKKIFNAIKKSAGKLRLEVVICPPFLYLPLLKGLKLGAQNVFYEEKGAFTGEISPLMLKNFGVEYVIIGHSERRKHFNEEDQLINKKIRRSLESGLKVIFCVGETEEERRRGEKFEVIKKQIEIGLKGVKNFKNLNIAYEPVWAIGTGNNCSIDETKEAISLIRKIVGNKEIRVLYGGSVNSKNSGSYVKQGQADGLLVGGASLIAKEFIEIIKSVL